MIRLFKKKNKKAFSLVEILVSITLISVIILGVNRVYFSISESQKEISEGSFVKTDIEHFFKIATNHLRSAQMGNGQLCGISSGRFFSLSEDLDSISFILDNYCLEFYLVEGQNFSGIRMYSSQYSFSQLISSSQTNVLDLIFQVQDDSSQYKSAVTILIKVAPKNDPENYSYFQTSVSLIN